MNHQLLHMLAAGLAPALPGRRIGVIRYERPVLSVPLEARDSTTYLIVLTAAPGPYCFTSPSDPLGASGTPVFKRIQGEAAREVSVPAGDRILRIDLVGGAMLGISLFGNSAKVRVTSDGTITDSLATNEVGTAEPAARAAADPGPSVLEGPFYLHAPRGARAAVPVPAAPESDALGPFDDAAAACRAVGEPLLAAARHAIRERHTTSIRKYITGRKKLITELERELRAAEDVDRERNEANILAAYRTQVKPGAKSATLPDLYQTGEKVTIALDPSRSLEEQIERRFKRVAKLERSLATLKERIVSVEAEMRHIQRELARAEREPEFDTAVLALQSLDAGLRPRQRRGPAAGAGRQTKTHRRYELDDGWFVLVGRSNKENDEITFRIAAPTDIWMHAQGVPGSHVVLKSTGAPGNPPERVLEQAAAIAAHYSKAKHSSLVPVIYTLRKYVRKPRGAKPGQVLCEREKTIFATPGLPPAESK